MPYASIPSLSRRTFALAMAGAGASLLRSAEPEMHWALISDTHIPADASDSYRGFNPVANLKKVVAEIEAAKPEAVLHCGDVARLQGLPQDYQAVQALLQPLSAKVPMAMALGNHDHRKNFLDVFGKSQTGIQSVQHKHVLVVEGPTVRVIVLDSLIEANSTPGLLGKGQRTWLAEYLKASSDLPTLLFVHHTLDDGDTSLLDAPRLFEIVKPHRKVKAILYGHSHAYKYEAWEGVHLLNLPAVGYNFDDKEPVGWVESRLGKDGGAFTLHAFGGNTEKNGKTILLPWRS
ncbi:metallophosphoesterase [uncultured Paludibaculum sp.]|uniref:metallophosphoesterase family protein n=1 Tax=uncultured Paludibaculum sp. TaxID=1765020 RepID=UPI002AAB530E|nr:metallophosphoesterase [uncultured Paludibaculum sp.]